jgi:hypothetical protein
MKRTEEVEKWREGRMDGRKEGRERQMKDGNNKGRKARTEEVGNNGKRERGDEKMEGKNGGEEGR